MANPSSIKALDSSGDVVTTTALLRGVVLVGGSDTAKAVVRAGGSAGTVILTVTAEASSTGSTGPLQDVFCSGGIHVTLSGTQSACSVIYA